MARLDRVATAVAALLIAVLGFLPIANWISGGFSIPTWGDLFGGWWSGTGVVVGVATVAAVLMRKVARVPGEWLLAASARSYSGAPAAWSTGLALSALGLYLWISQTIFSGKPLLIDEIAQVFQARLFAGGSLFQAAPVYPEFFSNLHFLNVDGKVFTQFPAGGPAMLALGAALGVEWIVGPVFGAVSVVLFAALSRHIEPRPAVRLGAIVLFAFAPFVVFMSGSHMNHVTLLTWLLLGMLGLARLMDGDTARLRDGVMLGLGFGVAATIRPGDALVFALPAGLWLLGRTLRTGRIVPLAGAGLGVLAPILVQLWINARTTGSPLVFAYNANWGKNQALGFHQTPWGEVHTPSRGVELLNLYFTRLQGYLFETPVPSLLPSVGALVLTRRLSPVDRYLLVTAGLLAGFYFMYWHDGFFLGPRFMFALAPFLALWTARFFGLLWDRFPRPAVARGLGVAVLASVLIAVFVSLPIRLHQYRSGLLTMRWDADSAARRAQVSNALVLVRESWGAQLVARMWAVGLTPDQAEYQYRKSDACALEQALDRVEQRALRGAAAAAELAPLFHDSARLVRSPHTADHTNRLLPGSRYTAECLQRLREDGQGFTLLAPLVLAGKGIDVIYARDLHARDTLLLQQYPNRALYLLRPASTEEGAPPQYFALRRDSLLSTWRRPE